MSAIAIFAVFLFLTYFLQQNLGLSPLLAGVAFLPMVGGIVISSVTAQVRLVPRFGARPLVPLGMALGCLGMAYLTGLGPHSSYAAHVLPSLLVMGFGFGLIFAPSISTATLGVDPNDSGIASAMVNVSQQVGGSIGTALLSTIAVSATTHYVSSHRPASAAVLAQGAVHGYTTAFVISASIFAGAGILAALLLRPKAAAPAPAPAPAPAREPAYGAA